MNPKKCVSLVLLNNLSLCTVNKISNLCLIFYLFNYYLNCNTTGCIRLKEVRIKVLEKRNLKYFDRCRQLFRNIKYVNKMVNNTGKEIAT